MLILIAKAGFTLDRLQTCCKGRKAAIGGTASEIRAPLTILLIVPGQRIADGIPDNEDPDRDRHCPHNRLSVVILSSVTVQAAS